MFPCDSELGLELVRLTQNGSTSPAICFVVVWKRALVLRDFHENGSQLGGRREIAQSRRSDADRLSRNVLWRCLIEDVFSLRFHVIEVQYDVMLISAVPVHRISHV